MRMTLEQGWQVLQDHYDLGESYRIYQDQYDPTLISAAYPAGAPFQLDEWRSVPVPAHLQTVLSDNPHLAPEMRLYNAAPWWYRLAFTLDEAQAAQAGRLHFGGVDYYCKVYLNGRHLGDHEGYQTAFSLDAPIRPGKNVLYVKVWSPLDFQRIGGEMDPRYLMVVRRMFKGTYEHGDSLLHRDRNPVGIWRAVELELYDNICLLNRMRVEPASNGQLTLRVGVKARRAQSITALCQVADWQTGAVVCRETQQIDLVPGDNQVLWRCHVPSPRRWSTWDREGPYLYEASLVLGEAAARETFGFREVALERTKERTCYVLNGEKMYVRGACYYPDPYLSLMHKGRIQRDLALLVKGGCNLVRVHVHQQIPEFYQLCDEMGIAVMQDTDFNWVHPVDPAWTNRALAIFRDQLEQNYNHPSILTWVLMNEPVEPGEPEMGRHAAHNRFVAEQPGPQLLETAKKLDGQRTFVLASYCEDNLDSGDSHNYAGSIDGPQSYAIRKEMKPEKFNTEFGFDAPPALASLLRFPQAARRLAKTAGEIQTIQAYQYRFLKSCIEGYRMMKYAPTSGHVQFMLVDCSPMAYYGVIDYWGCAKPGYQAFLESNQPIGLFHRVMGRGAGQIVLVNDLRRSFPGARLTWQVTGASGEVCAEGSATVDVQPDCCVPVAGLEFDPEVGKNYQMTLCLRDAAGNIFSRNRYDDLYGVPEHPPGHPYRFSHTYGIRLF